MCALVKGYTDILTPINLLPNSNFIRSGGLNSTVNFDTLDNVDHVVCENWCIERYNANSIITNVVVTRSTNSLRISGHVSATSNDITDLQITTKTRAVATSTIYTMGCTFQNNLGDDSVIESHMSLRNQSSTILYNQDSTTSNDLRKCFLTSDTQGSEGYYRITFAFKNNSDFDITISDCYLYEGSFVNPPITNSLDVKTGHQFVLKDELDYLSTNACLCKYMATAIDTSAALTTTGCIKDISGNGHHTQSTGSGTVITVPYLSNQGKVMQPVNTTTGAYAFNSILRIGPLNNNGDFDQMSVFTRFIYADIANTSAANCGCGIELASSSSISGGQNSRTNYMYVRPSNDKMGMCISLLQNRRDSDLTTLTRGHTYAAMFSVDLINGLRTIYIYDITTQAFIFSENVNITTKANGNGWLVQPPDNLSVYWFMTAGKNIYLMESACYTNYMNRDNFNYLVDNYHPEIGAAYLGA